MTKQNLNPNPDPNPDPANDNGGPIAPASKASALASTSLAALTTVLNNVDIASVVGKSGMPLMLFKARDNNGTWSFGAKRTIPEAGSAWAVNPRSFKRGYIAFNDNKKVAGEHFVPVSQPMPDVTELPDLGFPWQEEWGVSMKCLDGADRGVEVAFKAPTVGGVQAVAGLLDAVRDRLNAGQHDGKVSPIVRLEKDSYQHGQHGKTWYPVLTIIDWMPLDGPATAPTSPPPPTSPPSPAAASEQPRRRRVA